MSADKKEASVMLTMRVIGRVANERPYTDPTITWRTELTYTPDEDGKAPVSAVFNVPRGPGYVSGPGHSADDVFRYLQELAEDEWLDVEEMAGAFYDYDADASPAQVAQALDDTRALIALGRTIGEGLAPILNAMGMSDE